jgi:hypothetical protein
MTHSPLLGVSLPKFKIPVKIIDDIIAAICLLATSPTVLASDVMLTDVPVIFAVWMISAIWLMARGVERVAGKGGE